MLGSHGPGPWFPRLSVGLLLPQSGQLQFWTRISSHSPPGVCLLVDPCTRARAAKQRKRRRSKGRLGLHQLEPIHSKGLQRIPASCAVSLLKWDLTLHLVGRQPLQTLNSQMATITRQSLERTGGEHGWIVQALPTRSGLPHLLHTVLPDS